MQLQLILFIGSIALIKACPLICNCGLGPGEDVCRPKCTPLVVRPVELPKPILPKPKIVCAPVGGIPPLIPIAGPCSCHTAIVRPALVPKPPCLACQSCNNGGGGNNIIINSQSSQSLLQQQQLQQQQQILLGGSGVSRPILIDDSFGQNSNPAQLAPADAVSLSVAYNLAQKSCKQQEGQLAFGFKTIPKEVPQIRRKLNNIREENLFGLNGQIVELKPVACAGKSLDEEAADDLLALAEEEAEVEARPVKKLTLGEIGYGPAKIKGAPFIDVPLGNPVLAIEDKLQDAANADCKDGFQPGNVIIKELPNLEPIFDVPQAPLEPCASEPELFIPPVPTIPRLPCQNFPVQCVSCSSSSSLNSQQNQFQSNTFFQKLGCDDD